MQYLEKNKNNIINKVKNVIMALFVVVAIFAKNEVIEDVYPFSSYFGCFVMQCAYALESIGIDDLIVFVAVILLISHIDIKQIKYNICGSVIGLLFAITYYVCLSFYLYNDIILLKASIFQLFISIIRIIGYSILFGSVVRIVFDYMDNIDYEYDEIILDNFKSIWIKYTVIILVFWTPWMIMDFPGSFNIDSIDQLKAFYGEIVWTSHHPPLSTFIMGGFVSFGKLIGCTNIGVFLYILFQAVISASIFSYSIVKAYELGASKRYCMYSIMFFSILPMWGCFVQWFEKDLLYTAFILLFTINTVDIVCKKRCSIAKACSLFFVSLVVSLLRNNGIFCVVPTFILAIFYFRKNLKMKIITILILTISCSYLVNNVIYPSVGIKKGSIAEALSIPFQQTARYVRDFGNDVTDEEEEIINNTLEYIALPYIYNPVKSDPIKGTYKDDKANLKDYFIIWYKMFLKHPNVYVYSYINGAYSYLAPVEANVGSNMDYGEEEWLQKLGVKHIFSEFPIKIFDMLETGSVNWPVLRYFSMPGLYTWILLLLVVYIGIKRKYFKIIGMMPALMTVLICTAAPWANLLRYMQPAVACMPLLIAWTLSKKTEKENDEC